MEEIESMLKMNFEVEVVGGEIRLLDFDNTYRYEAVEYAMAKIIDVLRGEFDCDFDYEMGDSGSIKMMIENTLVSIPVNLTMDMYARQMYYLRSTMNVLLDLFELSLHMVQPKK